MRTNEETANIQMVERFVAAENEHDIEAIARLVDAGAEFYGNGTLVRDSWEGYRQVMQATLTAFPDSHREVLIISADGDLVAFRWRVTGTHRAEWNGISATGKSVVFSGTSWVQVANGRVIRAWFDMDLAGPLRQMTAP